MNNKGGISIFLIIVISSILIMFLAFFNVLSLKSSQNNLNRSLKLSSRNILANYDDYIYNNYGILTYKKTDEKSIKKEIIELYNNFRSPLNAYIVKDIDIEYNVKNIRNYDLLIKQILLFTKNDIADSFIKFLIEREEFQSKYQEKMKTLKEKLLKSKNFKKMKKIKKRMIKGNQNLNDLKEIISNYKSFQEELDNKIKYIEKMKESSDEKFNKILKIKEGFVSEKEESIKQLELVKKIKLKVKEMENKEDEKKKIERKIYKLMYLDNPPIKRIERLRNEVKLLDKEITILKRKIDNLHDNYKDLVIDDNNGNTKNIIEKINNSVEEIKNNLGIGKITKYKFINKSNKIEISKFNEMYFNEYILGTYKAIVDSQLRNFNFYTKNERDSISNSEVEYIINGKLESSINVKKIGEKILFTRELMNLAHLFIDNDKREFILSLSKVPGIGPLLSGGVSFLWSSGETSIDMVKLYKGKGTPLLKISDDNFVLDLDIIKGNKKLKFDFEIDEDPSFFYYNDYLRTLLLLTDNNKKMDRILNIIYSNYKLIDNNIIMDDFILEHNIKVNVNLKNKFTGKNKKIIFQIDEGYNE